MLDWRRRRRDKNDRPHDRIVVVLDVDSRTHNLHRCRCHFSLRLAHVLLAEEELTIEVADIDGVQVDLKTTSNYCKAERRKAQGKNSPHRCS